MRVVSRVAYDGTALLFGYDQLLTQAGTLTIARDPQNGRVMGTTLGNVTDTYGYDANGPVSAYVQVQRQRLYSQTVNTRNALNRITQKTTSSAQRRTSGGTRTT